MSEQELSYEEALIAAVLWARGGENYEQSIAAARASMDAISSAPRGQLFDIRAALARGPRGGTDPNNILDWKKLYHDTKRGCDHALADRDSWKARALAAEAKAKELEAVLEDAESTNQALGATITDEQKRADCAEARFKNSRDAWRKSALELEAKLADAALVEAGWVPREAAVNAMIERFTLHDYRSTFSDYIDSAVRVWLAARAQQAKGGGS